MNKLEIKDVSFSYGRNIVFEHFSVELESGINVFLGHNGSGKTTLFKMLASITLPQKGDIFLNGQSYKETDLRKQLSYIPQSFDVFPNITVNDFLRYIGKVKLGSQPDVIQKEIGKAVELTDVSEFLDKKMKKLSEGMRRRVGIAQALIGDPPLLIFDEPTAGLDPEQRARFNSTLRKISGDKIVLMSTHIIEDIKNFSDNIIILSKGAMTFQGSYDELVHSLDGKVFKTTVPLEQYREEAVKKDFIILHKAFEREEVMLKLALRANSPAPQGMISAEPNLTELWSYYE